MVLANGELSDLEKEPSLIGETVLQDAPCQLLNFAKHQGQCPSTAEDGKLACIRNKLNSSTVIGLLQIAVHISQCVQKLAFSAASLAQQWTCSGTCFCIWPRLIHMGNGKKALVLGRVDLFTVARRTAKVDPGRIFD